MAGQRKCPRCGAALPGFVDECPACGMERPLPLPWTIYGLMALMLAAAAWIFIDLQSIARAVLGVRGGFGGP